MVNQNRLAIFKGILLLIITVTLGSSLLLFLGETWMGSTVEVLMVLASVYGIGSIFLGMIGALE